MADDNQYLLKLQDYYAKHRVMPSYATLGELVGLSSKASVAELVLRLKAERADKKTAHWQGVAVAASEQCGRNRPPPVHEVAGLADWLKDLAPAADTAADSRLLLSLQGGARPLAETAGRTSDSAVFTFLSGPEGGLSPAEETAALACGFAAVTLGPRVLRTETAPLVVLSLLGI